MGNTPNNPLKTLALADPALAANLSASLEARPSPLPEDEIVAIVEHILESFSEEISFGEAVARGYTQLAGIVSPKRLGLYRDLVSTAAKTGPSLGKVMATYGAPVVAIESEHLLDRFLAIVNAMQQKGLHTKPEPLDALSDLLNKDDLETAMVYAQLLLSSLTAAMPFAQIRHICHALPKALHTFSKQKRIWQLKQLSKIAATNAALIEPFLEGMQQGLFLLSEQNLAKFVAMGIERATSAVIIGGDFLSLKTRFARQTLKDMRVAVSLPEIKGQLNRYLQARTGSRIAIEPVTSLPIEALGIQDKPLVLTDGRNIFLPDEIETFNTYEENKHLFLVLTKMESGLLEFGTFDFDLERFQNLNPAMPLVLPAAPFQQSDIDVFLDTFPCPAFAFDLYTIFEHARVWHLMAEKYPGLIRQATPLLLNEIYQHQALSDQTDTRLALYAGVTLGIPAKLRSHMSYEAEVAVGMLIDQFHTVLKQHIGPETSGTMTQRAYATLRPLMEKNGPPVSDSSYSPCKTPFGRKVYPSLFWRSHQPIESMAEKLKTQLRSKGIFLHRSDVRKELVQNNGQLSSEGMTALLKRANYDATPPSLTDVLSHLSEIMPDLINQDDSNTLMDNGDSHPAAWYPEWDDPVSDYRLHHVRVLEKPIPTVADDSYDNILNTYRPLVKTIRHAFALLKPEGLSLLRYWVEGDEFDYRALLNVVIDKKAGQMPSDRIYIKRLKQERDVAVMLLVDLSGSTKNVVPGTNKPVLYVEKEAIILFCEALEVVGDTFAIAGFSGHGRLGVDYYPIKDFEEPLDATVQQKISGMRPQRSTRIGGAIRHAISKLEKVPARIRLLITLGDGYPNDIGYKGDYAVADTRKAIAEARTKGIFVRPITVNLSVDENIDTLYDNLHHNIISDIQDLPNKLWRIYSDYTR